MPRCPSDRRSERHRAMITALLQAPAIRARQAPTAMIATHIISHARLGPRRFLVLSGCFLGCCCCPVARAFFRSSLYQSLSCIPILLSEAQKSRLTPALGWGCCYTPTLVWNPILSSDSLAGCLFLQACQDCTDCASRQWLQFWWKFGKSPKQCPHFR